MENQINEFSNGFYELLENAPEGPVIAAPQDKSKQIFIFLFVGGVLLMAYIIVKRIRDINNRENNRLA